MNSSRNDWLRPSADFATPCRRSLLLSAFASSSSAATHYVFAGNPTPTAPYTDWSTAATNIQDAVDAAASGDTVLVTNGVYQYGGRAVYTGMTNRVAITKALTVESVNGPLVTAIIGNQVPVTTNGSGAIRCVYLASGASVTGFTLTNGATTGLSPAYEPDDIVGGGGVYAPWSNSVVSDCIITGNFSYLGGGVDGGILRGCAIVGNLARVGGGCFDATLYNCTVSGNSAGSEGGSWSGVFYNCIVYFNNAETNPNYDSYGVFNYCCTTPLPTNGVNNIMADPQLADPWHISVNSPCRGAGYPTYASGTDIDGDAWLNPPSIGCDEYNGSSATGSLSVALSCDYTNFAVGFSVNFTSSVAGHALAAAWDFGDGVIVSNELYTSHSWSAPGDYAVSLRAFNNSNPVGVVVTLVVHVSQETHYVSVVSASPLAPYNSWATAATNIQDAVDAATVPGAMVIVSNGVYQSGARVVFGAMSNRVAVTQPLVLTSVNGPAVTTILGYQAPGAPIGSNGVRCVYLSARSVLSGFTVSNGGTLPDGDIYQELSGGGILGASVSAVVSNCVLSSNVAAFFGGGPSRLRCKTALSAGTSRTTEAGALPPAP